MGGERRSGCSEINWDSCVWPDDLFLFLFCSGRTTCIPDLVYYRCLVVGIYLLAREAARLTCVISFCPQVSVVVIVIFSLGGTASISDSVYAVYPGSGYSYVVMAGMVFRGCLIGTRPGPLRTGLPGQHHNPCTGTTVK